MSSAMSEGRARRAGVILVFVSEVLVVLADHNKSIVYTIEAIPKVFFEVIGRYIR